jgi:serine/threonine kinase PknH
MLESLDLKRPGARRFHWILGGASLLVAVVVTVVVALTMSGSDGPKLIEPAQLEKVLLSAKEINAIMGTSDMKGDAPDKVTHDTPGGVNPPPCFGVFYNADPEVYKNSGYTDARNQALTSPTTGGWINQSGIEFRSPSQAGAFVRYLAGLWKMCSSRPVEMTEKNGTSVWAFAPLDDNGSQIVQTLTLQNQEKNYVCQHVLRPESNVVIEVQVCSDHVSEDSIRIAGGMADKVIDLTT